MLGKWYTAAAYTNSSVFDSILNITDNSWIKIIKSDDGSLVMTEGNKLWVFSAGGFLTIEILFIFIPNLDGAL